MELSEYIKSQGHGAVTRLSRAIKAPSPDVSKWASGERPCPPHRCVAIEVATSGKVTRKKLRPSDWWLIWPELIEAGSHEIAL